MKGKADGNTLEYIETIFKWKRDEKVIRQLSDTVTNYEYRLRKQAEALEQARLLDEQAQKLKEKAKDIRKQ
jgi:hypothetical protein